MDTTKTAIAHYDNMVTRHTPFFEKGDDAIDVVEYHWDNGSVVFET